MSTESWYTTRNTSTWFEASDAQAWVPTPNVSSGNNKKPLPNAANIKNLKTAKSDSTDRGSKEQKLEQRTVAPPQSDISSKFFELPSTTLSDQDAWNAYVLSNASKDGWDKPNDVTPPSVPEKVVFSKLKRNVDIEAELTKQNLYKTETCQSWMETGTCRYGNKCQYAHGKAELRPVIRHPKYKTEVCKTFSTTGQCPYGKRCRFVHQLFERRNDQEDEDNTTEEEAMLQRKLEEISLSLAPDPVFPVAENSDPVISANHVKKGSRLPFLQKLRKQL